LGSGGRSRITRRRLPRAKKADEFARANALEPSELIQARLVPDMFTFAQQIQSARDKARFGVARLCAIETPSFPDIETTFAELEARLAKTVVFLRADEASRFDGSEGRTIDLKSRGMFRGDAYLLTMLLPDFFFRVATAHGILRQRGVPIGKADYRRRSSAS
jgi:hypothetical protein